MRTTFLLLSYNQEAYAAEAVKAALAQDGEPITILISDDASTDRTFEIIQAAVAGYSGHHRVELNRNPHNLGLAAHINACMRKITTEYVIAAAADDISMPQRAIRVCEAFNHTNALLLHSRFEEIDKTGMANPGSFPSKAAFFLRDTSALRATEQMGLYVGATGAWHRSLFDIYGEIDDGCYEDLILGFRAALESRIAFIDEVLVRYRTGVGISAMDRTSGRKETWRSDRMTGLARKQSVFSQRLRDASRSSHQDRTAISSKLEHAIRINCLRMQCCEQGALTFLGRNMARPHVALLIILSERRKRKRAKKRARVTCHGIFPPSATRVLPKEGT
ncbi:glycosyltransferase, partial [Cypionkella aquatica]|uniref:glycosyltransferase n=1 Tax=Cypionkella aquatica TaxID=1756042 RepID=UPI0024E0603D